MKTFSIENVSKIQYVEKINDEFALCRCYVMGTKKNRNYSYIAKETVEKNLGTLDYCPVVGYLYKNKNGEYRIAGHECHFDDDWDLVPDTQAFGVVKPNSYHWEVINEFGVDVEYLVVDILLWIGRFKGLFDARYNDEIYYGQSMEISVNEYRPLEEDSNYIEILDFSFSALCLLGKYDDPDENVTPCFINARVEPKFSISDFVNQIEEIKNKLFSLENPKEEGGTMEDNKELTTETEIETTETEVGAIDESAAEAENAAETEVSSTETVDYEALYNEAQSTISELTNKVNELTATVASLTPYKLAAEKAEREKAESDVFAKYDSRIGEMDEYKTLKSNAGKYNIADLERECLILVGKFAMNETATENVDTKPETTITFAFDDVNETKTNRYGNVYENYKTR